MARITLGHPEAHEKLTARLFWKLKTETGYNDAGNVREYADATTRSLVTRARAEDGARHVNDEQVDVNHEAWTFLLDERDPAQEKLLKLARRLSNETQAAVEGTTATIEDVENGKWYAIGAYNIQNVRVTASSSGLQDEGTDYVLDKENGRIQVVDGAGIGDAETLTLTFDEPQIILERYESQYAPLFYCDIIIEEHNQYHKMWLRRMAFSGYLNPKIIHVCKYQHGRVRWAEACEISDSSLIDLSFSTLQIIVGDVTTILINFSDDRVV